MRWRLAGAVIAIAALTGSLTGCGLPQDGRARPVADQSVPYGLLGPRSDASAPATTSQRAASSQPRTYLLNADQLLEAVPANVDTSQEVTRAKVLAALFAALSAGPNERQRSRGLSTALAPGVRVTLLALHDGIADLQIEGAPKDPAADRLPLAVGQLVLTATSVVGVDAVQLLRDGEPVEVPLPGGALTSSPLRRNDYRELIARPTASATASPTTS